MMESYTFFEMAALWLYYKMNNQQISKILNFFRLNFQFHQPYQLILDGNFIKLLVEK